MKRILLVVMAGLAAFTARADEGMWLLPMMKQLNIEAMKDRGLKLSAEDIYSVNHSSLKDAIIIFGAGCTGEIVSKDGLLFTNHHCGYSAIQALSSVEHDYLKYGFWAENRGAEIPAPGISATFIREIIDVTDDVLKGITHETGEVERAKMVSDNSQAVIERYRTDYPSKDLYLTPFFGGNQYFLFVREIYTDVRLVGTPPSSIGKFGGETDNWMWPRHTCDFSVFRVYAAPDGKTPAEYSKDNVPYQAPTHLKVSTKGYKEGDFAMIMGFPGRTQRFMTSWEIDQLLEYENPNRIFVRGERQDVLKKFMAESDEVRIKYASKYAVSSNYWKNSIGKNRGVRKLGLKSQREALETEFTTWAKGTEYAQALPLIREAVEERTLPASESQLMGEIITGAEVLLYALNLGLPLTGNNRNIAEITEKASTLYKDYDAATDRAVSRVMLKILMDSVPEVIPAALEPHKAHLADYIHDNSVFASQDKFNAYLAAGDYSNLVNDPAFMLAKNINDVRRELTAKTNAANEKFTRGHRLLIAGLAKMSPEKPYYPDANSTLRLTYGNILSYSPADAVKYNYQTHLAGVIEKYDPTNLVDFDIPERLKQLYEEGNNPPTCFIANTDITGGNSGSPVLNARGELIGIAFDGNWDAMSSDVAFEPVLQRTISVDIRYVLFIISKFANSQHIIKELDFN